MRPAALMAPAMTTAAEGPGNATVNGRAAEPMQLNAAAGADACASQSVGEEFLR